MEALTTSSLNSPLGRIRNLAPDPIAEFSSFKAMELLEAIKNAAHDSKNEKANCYKLTCERLSVQNFMIVLIRSSANTFYVRG